jgi:hypothetical protein
MIEAQIGTTMRRPQSCSLRVPRPKNKRFLDAESFIGPGSLPRNRHVTRFPESSADYSYRNLTFGHTDLTPINSAQSKGCGLP